MYFCVRGWMGKNISPLDLKSINKKTKTTAMNKDQNSKNIIIDSNNNNKSTTMTMMITKISTTTATILTTMIIIAPKLFKRGITLYIQTKEMT